MANATSDSVPPADRTVNNSTLGIISASATNFPQQNQQNQRNQQNQQNRRPSPSEIRRIISAQTQANAATVVSNQAPDATYVSSWRKFTQYIDQKRVEGTLDEAQGAPYITRDNVDFFFTNLVSTYDCSVEHARKNIYAIRWYSKFKEHVGQEVFTVESNDVAVALRKVKKIIWKK